MGTSTAETAELMLNLSYVPFVKSSASSFPLGDANPKRNRCADNHVVGNTPEDEHDKIAC